MAAPSLPLPPLSSPDRSTIAWPIGAECNRLSTAASAPSRAPGPPSRRAYRWPQGPRGKLLLLLLLLLPGWACGRQEGGRLFLRVTPPRGMPWLRQYWAGSCTRRRLLQSLGSLSSLLQLPQLLPGPLFLPLLPPRARSGRSSPRPASQRSRLRPRRPPLPSFPRRPSLKGARLVLVSRRRVFLTSNGSGLRSAAVALPRRPQASPLARSPTTSCSGGVLQCRPRLRAGSRSPPRPPLP